MAGAVTERKKQKELVEKMLVDRAPKSIKAAMDYMERDFAGRESGVATNPVTGEVVLDDDGKPVGYMTNTDIERMKHAHKIFHKYFDKIIPSKLIVEKHQENFIDERFNQALDVIVQNDAKRIEREGREMKEVHAEVID